MERHASRSTITHTLAPVCRSRSIVICENRRRKPGKRESKQIWIQGQRVGGGKEKREKVTGRKWAGRREIEAETEDEEEEEEE